MWNTSETGRSPDAPAGTVGSSLASRPAEMADGQFCLRCLGHSMAITRAERSQLEDVRVCELAVEISEAQRREIVGMGWLIEDIRRNGVSATPKTTAARPVPDYETSAEGQCPGG